MNTSREITVGYLDTQKKFFSSQKGRLEFLLKSFGKIAFREVKSLDDDSLRDCHALLTTADHVPDEDFLKWFLKFEKKVHLMKLIWIPTIILADLELATQKSLLDHSLKSNWYFDIVAGSQLNSLPIRLANMIRIHDHLKELYHYDRELNALQGQVLDLETQIRQLSAI